MSPRKDWMNKYEPVTDLGLNVVAAHNATISCQGHGSVVIKVRSNGCLVSIDKTMYVPDLSVNLICLNFN